MREAMNLRQSQTGALADRLGGEEGIEDLAEDIGRDAGAGILHRDRDMSAGAGLAAERIVVRRYRDDAAGGHGVARVDDEIDQRRFELGDVDHDRPDARVDVELQRHRAADAGVEHFAHRIDAFGDIDGLRIDALPPCECQQLAGEGGAALGRPFDRRYRPLAFGIVANRFLQRVKTAADDHQEIVEIMGHAAGQLAERVELLRFRELLLHLLELELGFAALGNVPGDLGEADELAVLVDGVDDDAGPEEGAVLADAPAFLLVAALFPGNAQGAERLAVGAVDFGIEAGEMLPDDFVGRVALDPLAADVPARDHAGRVQHVQRVVGNAFNQKSEITFGFE